MPELLAIFATWKISIMLMQYDGPLGIFETIRHLADAYQQEPKLITFDCLFCLSTIVALPFALYLADGWAVWLYWFGVAGGAYFINEFLETA